MTCISISLKGLLNIVLSDLSPELHSKQKLLLSILDLLSILSQLILDTTLIYAQDDRGSKQSLQQQGSKSLSEGNEKDL